jgi:ectoine hydroxylase-related dioxygenase (phytanoyl-CoA dioxygenase family)
MPLPSIPSSLPQYQVGYHLHYYESSLDAENAASSSSSSSLFTSTTSTSSSFTSSPSSSLLTSSSTSQPKATLTDMIDSTDLLKYTHNSTNKPLQERLKHDGYLYLRDFFSKQDVENARKVVCEVITADWNLFEQLNSTNSNHQNSVTIYDTRMKEPLMNDSMPSRNKGLLLTGYRSITHHPQVLALLHSAKLASLMRTLFESTPATFDTKWVRVLGEKEFTDEHTDYYRFEEQSKEMVTCWIPLGNYTKEGSTLCICEGSHHLNMLHQQSGEELPSEFNVQDSKWIWRTTNVNIGDCIIFDIRSVHASTKNQTNTYRLSMDTRWQPAQYVSPDLADQFVIFNDV